FIYIYIFFFCSCFHLVTAARLLLLNVSNIGILKSPLQVSKDQLRRSLIKDQLKSGMQQRRDANGLGLIEETDAEDRAIGIENNEDDVENPRENLEEEKEENFMFPKESVTHIGTEELKKRTSDLRMRTNVTTRRNRDELEQRGLLPRNYLEKLYGGESPTQETDAKKQEKRKARKSLLIHLKQRPSLNEIQQRGFANPLYWKHENPEDAQQERQAQIAETEKQLNSFLSQRSKPEDVVYRGILTDTDYFFEDKEAVEAAKKRSMQNKKNNIQEHLSLKRQVQKSNLSETPTQNGVETPSNDNDNDGMFFEKLKQIASQHHRFSSAVGDLKTQLPGADERAQIVAEVMLEHVEGVYPEIKLCRDPNCNDPRHNHSTNDTEQALQTENTAEKRRRSSILIEQTLRNRESVHELGQKGFIKNAHIARRLQPAATDLENRIENRMAKQQMESLGLVRRPSLVMCCLLYIKQHHIYMYMYMYM
ncbi:poly E-rich protein, partial [Reticulomyxa filosa]